VGQALRCRITDSKGQTRDCIVKILRPDAPNRAARERDIFLNAAKQVSGMEGTFKGQYDKIMEELDFTIEYKNAKMGALYNNPFSGEKKIQSVKVVEDIPPSTSYMAMEIAPGDTLVGFYDSTRARLNEIGMSFGASEVFDEKGVRTSVSYTASPTQRQEIIDTKNELMQLFTETKKRYEQMLALTEVWVKEGIFGEQGFFHGDLHGGNIMSDGDTLTAIDFGNATSLSTEQQSKVITMMIAASTKQTTKFLDALRPLLTDEARQVMDAKYNDLREALRVVMRKGGNGETGTRIGAILAVLQKYGVSIPASLFNFSSSELRLQTSVAELGALMEEIKEDMEALGEARVNALEGTAEMFEDTNQAMQMMAQHINQQTVQNHITNGKNKVDWATELLDVPGISYDENGVIQEAGLPPEFADGGEKAAGRELLSNVIQNVNLFISQPSQVGVFYAMHVEPFPEAKAAWDSNIDKATNMQLTQAERNQARAAIMKALMKVSKDTLTQFESEVNADPVYGGRVDSFFGVVNDVCQANRAASAWKLGVVSAIKYALFDKI
ncbi:MAG: AarF/UbiB family protein, partial [Desulfovibrio sp.]